MISIETWRARGTAIDTPDGRVWAIETRASSADANLRPPAILFHGFPTSSWDFAECMEILAQKRRVVAFDWLGLGLSDKPAELGYSLFEQADVALAVARHFGIGRAHLWAHDMGTSVATEICARRVRACGCPLDLASLTLTNGSVHAELASLTFGQHLLRSPLAKVFARWNNVGTFRAQMRRIFVKPPSDEVLDTMWGLLARDDGLARLPQIIGYIAERSRFRRRWISALERFDRPALIAWGRLDPVALHVIAQELARDIPGSRTVTWDDLGHYPHVEDPPRVATAIASFWDRVDSEDATGDGPTPSSRPSAIPMPPHRARGR